MNRKFLGLQKLGFLKRKDLGKKLWKDIHNSRRGFIKKAGLTSLFYFLGGGVNYADKFESKRTLQGNSSLKGKHPELVLLNDRPLNAETPAHLLNDTVTPAKMLFVRNNGIVPKEINPNEWILTIEGESARQSKTYSLDDLKSKFPTRNYQLTIECGGNGRSEFYPPAKGNQWTTGAVGCPLWTGVSLKDLLNDVGLKDDAVYIGYYGADTHLSGDPEKVVISRGVPIKKALEDESLIAWGMNGGDLPVYNGYPLRLVFGGWPASTSGKWLKRIVIRNKIHDGPKMEGESYRVPCSPIAAGTKTNNEEMCIIESMPVKSLITYPKSGAILRGRKSMKVNGHAWAGDHEVQEMFVSINFGAHWERVKLNPPVNRLAWQQWEGEVNFPGEGYYEVWARAVDSRGISQPMVVPGWNPKGYLNNACHRIAVKVE